MNSKLLIPLIIIGVVAIVIGAFVFSQNSSPSGTNLNTEMVKSNVLPQEKPTDNQTTDSNNASSRYVEYSKSAFDNLSNTKRVLFFYASWCPTCRPSDESFMKNQSRIPEDVTVIRVNYNDPETDQEEKDLAKKYGVTYQHTFVQINNLGKEVAKWNGGQIDELLSNIK